MPRKNLLSLHEAIVIALINSPIRTASFEEIAAYITARNLYPERKGNISLATQVMLRSTKANGAYHHLFEEIGAGYIRLRDSYADIALMLYEGFDAILNHHSSFYQSSPVSIRMKDVKMDAFRKISITAPCIICITTKEASGEKKFIYVKESDMNGKETIGIYTINKSLADLLKTFDPLNHYLTMLSDSTVINVSCFRLTSGKTLIPLIEDNDLESLLPFRFSTSKKAKEYYSQFLLIQDAYKKRISFEKSILEWQKQL